MALAGMKVCDRSRDVLREPIAVVEGHHAIFGSVPHRYRPGDAREVESPVTDGGERVIAPAGDPLDSARRVTAAMNAANSPERAALSTSETIPPRGGGEVGRLHLAQYWRHKLVESGERLLSRDRRRESLDIFRAHARQPVQAIRAVRRQPSQRHRRSAPAGQEGGARERMRPAPQARVRHRAELAATCRPRSGRPWR